MKRALVFLIVAVTAMALGQGEKPLATSASGELSKALQLLIRDDVQADIALTAEQKQKLTAIRKETAQAEQKVYSKDPKGQSKASQDELAAIHKQHKEKIEASLTPEQMARLKEIDIQLQGNMAADNAGIVDTLALTEDQKAKIKALNDAHGKDLKALFERVKSRELSARDSVKAMQARNDQLNDEIGKLLTPEQAAKLKELGGKPFKPTPPPSNKDGGN